MAASDSHSGSYGRTYSRMRLPRAGPVTSSAFGACARLNSIMWRIFPSTVSWEETPSRDCPFCLSSSVDSALRYLQVACMNELGNVVSRGQANMDGMFRPGASIIIFEPLSQGVSRDADNGIHLRVKRFRAPKGVHCNAVLLDFVDGSFEVFLANKGEQSKQGCWCAQIHQTTRRRLLQPVRPQVC